MATKKTPAPPSEVADLKPIAVRPLGYNGLNVTSGIVFEECDPALRWPECQYTYKKMLKDATVGISVEAVQTDMARIPWYVNAPAGYEEDLQPYVDRIRTMITDMDHSWLSFIKLATSYVPYGFAPFEIIPKKRLKTKGSKYNDGYWGIGKLALRSQDTISHAEFSEDGREFLGFWQRVNKITNKGGLRTRQVNIGKKVETEVFLPIEKLLLFRNNPVKDSPLGQSPLAQVYESWKYKKAYETSESHGVNLSALSQ